MNSKRMYLLLWSLMAWVVGASFLPAQEYPDNLSIAQVNPGPEAGTLQILVTAVDEQEAPLTGLSQADFKVRIDNQSVPVSTVVPVSQDREPLSVVLVLDISASMGDRPLRIAQTATETFVNQLGPEDYCCLVLLGTGATTKVAFTQDKTKVTEKLAGPIVPNRQKWLYDAMVHAADVAASRETNRGAIVVLSDGRDNGSEATLEQAVLHALMANVPVYCLGFGQKIDPKVLRQIAKETGGRYLHAHQQEALAKLYQDVLKQLENQYLLTVSAPTVGGPHQAVVTLSYQGRSISRQKPFGASSALALGAGTAVPPQGEGSSVEESTSTPESGKAPGGEGETGTPMPPPGTEGGEAPVKEEVSTPAGASPEGAPAEGTEPSGAGSKGKGMGPFWAIPLGLAVLAAGVWGAIRGYEVWRRRDKARRKQAAPGPTEPGSTGTPKTDSWPGSDTPLAQLRVVEGPQREGEVIPISERGVVIGRGEGTLEGTGATPLRLPDDEQHRVGRKHAEIVLDPTTGDRTFILRDLESTNGTFVNGEKITERVLQPGDEIDIGHRYRLRFEEV